MKASTKRSLSFLISLALIMLASLVYGMFIRGAYTDIQTQRGTIAVLENKLAENQGVIQRIQALLSRYQDSTLLQEKVNLALPQTPFTSQILSDAQVLADVNGIKLLDAKIETQPLRSRSVTTPKFVKDIGISSFQLTVQGSYEKFKAFLAQLENNVRIMDVQTIAITPVIQVSQDGKVATTVFNPDEITYALKVFAYYQNDVQQPVTLNSK